MVKRYREVADDADLTLEDMQVPPFTDADRAALYDVNTLLRNLPPLVERLLWSRGNDGRGPNRDWHTDKSADFYGGYEDAGYNIESPRLLRRFARLMQNHFLRGDDYRIYVDWLEDERNHDRPIYEEMLRAYQHRIDNRLIDPRKPLQRRAGHGMVEIVDVADAPLAAEESSLEERVERLESAVFGDD